MENTLRTIEAEDIVIYKDLTYGHDVVQQAKIFFENLRNDGIIVGGHFEDKKWTCYSDVRTFEINFMFDKRKYENHVGKEFGISYETMQQMIKCYTAYCTGEYIFSTIAREIVNVIKSFLCEFKERDFRLTALEIYRVKDFLAFINTPEQMIERMVSNIRKIAPAKQTVRKLSHLMHYLAIENEINEMFNGAMTDEDFIKYFPIFFWVNITFVLPLRATEMLVTPFDCIRITDDEVTLKVRRSKLKGGGKNRVYYDVERDYEIFVYHLRNLIQDRVFEVIKCYQEITKDQERRFLFSYGKHFSRKMLSLSGFNNLIKVFMDERIIHNPKYEYAKRVSGLDEFEYVTAGDSRPIAMANLYFQNAGADICRQLANHMNITTSEGYYTNVTETLYCSSIMQMQNRINKDYIEEKIVKNEMVLKDEFGCSNPNRMHDKKNIKDCKGYYEDCFGCKFYCPDDWEICQHMEERNAEFEECVKKMQNVLKSANKIKGRDTDIDELFLQVHTTSVRYKECTDVFAEKEAKKWVNQQNLKKIYC